MKGKRKLQQPREPRDDGGWRKPPCAICGLAIESGSWLADGAGYYHEWCWRKAREVAAADRQKPEGE